MGQPPYPLAAGQVHDEVIAHLRDKTLRERVNEMISIAHPDFRDELLAATIELFAEGGSRAVTHRAVARRAGLPPATTTYYFASIEDLLREALSEHMKQWMTDLEGLTRFDPGDLPPEKEALWRAVMADPEWQRASSPQERRHWLDLLEAELADGALGIGIVVGYAPRSGVGEYLDVARLERREVVGAERHVADHCAASGGAVSG